MYSEDPLAYGLGTVVSLVGRSLLNPYFSTLLSGLLSGWLVGDTSWTYTPDLANLFSAYPEKLVLLLLGLLFRNHDNLPVKSFMRKTSGRLVPELHYTFFDLPERCILLMHHRRHHHPGLTVQEFHDMFYLLPDDVPFKIVTGRDWGSKKDLISKGLKVLEERLYNAVDVRGCSKLDGASDPNCMYTVYEPFKNPGPLILVIFPDKFGAQYFGDTSMFYRSGAFAAAVAAGVPIVDTLSMYPTFAHQYHTAKTTRVVFPNSTWPKPNTNLTKEDYQSFVRENATEIEALRIQMQTLFLEDIKVEESKVASCDKEASVIFDASGPVCARCLYINGKNSVVCLKQNGPENNFDGFLS